MSNSELLKMTDKQLFDEIPSHKKQDFIDFIKELNRREYLVRFAKSCTFESFQHLPGTSFKFGNGFIVNGKSVPYFHPNRSFHDEIIWLNNYHRKVYEKLKDQLDVREKIWLQKVTQPIS